MACVRCWVRATRRCNVSHAIIFVTPLLVTLSLGFSSIGRSLTEAAAPMDADDRVVFRTNVVPFITPDIISGYAFAFVLSRSEYIVASMTVGFTMETLSIKIFNASRYGYRPTMAPVTVLLVATAAFVFGLIARFADLRRLLGATSQHDDCANRGASWLCLSRHQALVPARCSARYSQSATSSRIAVLAT